MQKVVILLIMVLMVLGASAQKVDLKKLGNTLRSMNLSMAYGVRKDMFVVKDNATGLYGIMNLKGEMLQQPEYRWIYFPNHEELVYLQTTDTTFGLMNSQGQWVVQAVSNEYDNNYEMYYDLYVTYLLSIPRNGKWKQTDSLVNWRMLTEYKFTQIVDEERRWVTTVEGLYDIGNQQLLLKGVENVWKVGDNLYNAQKDGYLGMIDTLGRWVVEPRYDYGWDYSEGLAVVERDGKSGYIDTLGREVVPLKYDGARNFSNGLASVRMGSKWGYIDKSGREVIPCKYDLCYDFQKNGMAIVRVEEDGKKLQNYIIDRNDNVKAIIEDRVCVDYKDNLILWGMPYEEGKYWLTDYEGKELATYDEVMFGYGDYYSDEDMIPVRQGRMWGLVDKDYRLIIPCKYRRTEGYSNGPGAIVTLDDGSTRYIDRRGRTIFKLDGLESVRKVGKDLYLVTISPSEGEEHYYKSGLVDGKGRSTFSKAELESARKAYLESLESFERLKYPEKVVEEDVEEVAEPESVTESFDEDEVFAFVEESAEFPGGVDSLHAFLEASIQYPELAMRYGIEGKVFVQFVVEKDGSISNIKVLREIGAGCSEEAVRVIKMMPKWQPAKVRGKAVRFHFILPVPFSLEKVQSGE